MDLPPLFPEDFTSHDISSTVTYGLQEVLQNEIYDKQVAKDITNSVGLQALSDIGEDFNAYLTIRSYEKLHDEILQVERIEMQLLAQHAQYLVDDDAISNIKEYIKLQPCGLFKKIETDYLKQYRLLEKEDLLPVMIYRYLDFRYDEYKLYKSFKHEEKSNKILEKKSGLRSIKHLPVKEVKKKPLCLSKRPLQFVPECLVFENCEPNVSYEKTVKIVNASSKLQSISLKHLTKINHIDVDFYIGSRIAPGMSTSVKITFTPSTYKLLNCELPFKTSEGYTKNLKIKSTRKTPEIIMYILQLIINTNKDDSLKLKRLTNVIDFGTCLVGDYIPLSVLLQNKGMWGHFFILKEEEWNNNIDDISFNLEVDARGFWMYPAYFEIDTEQIVEINTIFLPITVGVHRESFVIICNNLSVEPFELTGNAVFFKKSLLTFEVAPNDVEIENKEEYCAYFGGITNKMSRNLIVTVHNKSCIKFNFQWEFKNKSMHPQIYNIEKEWITQDNKATQLMPYGHETFVFQFTMNAATSGYHSIFLKFMVLNLPENCLEKEIKSLMRKNTNNCATHLIDVQALEFEVACFVNLPEICKETNSCSTKESQIEPKIIFSSFKLNFGILPLGLRLTKEIQIINLSYQLTLKWRIIEIKCNLVPNNMEDVSNKTYISCNRGELDNFAPFKIEYTVDTHIAEQWVSILLLIYESEPLIVQSACLVIFESIQFDISVKTGNTIAPIICPMNIMYVDVPMEVNFRIKNKSPITGCYYFLKSIGADCNKLKVKLKPEHSQLKPWVSVTVTAELTCSEIGIFQDDYFPCFIGMLQEPIIFRVLCAVDGKHFLYYLPIEENKYRKVLWPPKFIYEYDEHYCMCEQTITNILDFLSVKLPSVDEILQPSATQTTVITQISTCTKLSNEYNSIMEVLEKKMGNDLELNDQVIEITKVPAKHPIKFTFYIENVTPIKSQFSVSTANFAPNKDSSIDLLKFSHAKKDKIWQKLVNPNFGIMVQSEVESGTISESGAVKIDLWIYATTWGFYKEVVTVDIKDIPPFQFTLLIEIIGISLFFPATLHSSSGHPSIRLGTLGYKSNPIHRKVVLVNETCATLIINWTSFLFKPRDDNANFTLLFDLNPTDIFKSKLLFLEEQYGISSNKCCEQLKILYDSIRNIRFGFINVGIGMYQWWNVVELLSISKELTIEFEVLYLGKVLCDKIYQFYRAGLRISSLLINNNYNLIENFMKLAPIVPANSELPGDSSIFLNLQIYPGNFEAVNGKTDFHCFIVGTVHVEKEFKRLNNYFYRPVNLNDNKLLVEIKGSLEEPKVELDGLETEFSYNATDIIDKEFEEYCWRINIQNRKLFDLHPTLIVTEPYFLKLRQTDKQEFNTMVCHIQPKSCFELYMGCRIYSTFVKQVGEDFCNALAKNSDSTSNVKFNFDDNYVQFYRYLSIHHKEGPPQEFLLQTIIQYPKISAQPTIVKFDSVVIGRTSKSFVTIINETRQNIDFKIHKSVNCKNFYIHSHRGKVEAKKGLNNGLTNVFVYFTPKSCKLDHCSFRIVTNIPGFYIEIQLKGQGTLNNKNYIDYKI